MIILYDNKAAATATTISSLTENPYYTFSEGLKDSRLSRVGRTLDDAAQWVKFDLGSAASVTHCIINGHNLTSGATVTLEGNATDVWTSPTVSESLTVADVIYKTFTGASLRYWRITIDDASNPDTYIQIASVFLGTALTLPGFDPAGSIFGKSSSTATRSISRQLYGQRRTQYKIAEIDIPTITYAQKLLIDACIQAVDVTEPFYFIIWENDVDIEPPVYMAFDEYPEILKTDDEGLIYTTKFKVSEVG